MQVYKQQNLFTHDKAISEQTESIQRDCLMVFG